MKAELWVATNKVGSKCSVTLEIPDEDLDGMTDIEIDKYMWEEFQDQCTVLYEWGYVFSEVS